MKRMESNRQHSGRRHVASVPLVETDGWGREPAPPVSILVILGQVILLTVGGVAAGSSPCRRRSALFSTRAVWTAMRIEGSAAIDIQASICISTDHHERFPGNASSWNRPRLKVIDQMF